MTCGFCGTRIGEGESRCRRCGRRPDDTLGGQARLVMTDGALATKLAPVPRLQIAETQPPQNDSEPIVRDPASFSRAVQRPLFQDRPPSKIVPIQRNAPPP